MVVTFLMAGLWAMACVEDMRKREVSLLVLLALTILSLLGHPFGSAQGKPCPWWGLAALVLLWPPRWRRWCLSLIPLTILIGVITDEQAAALALVAGVLAWSLHWWGGADGILLFALALRHGLVGLIVGAVAAVLAGLALMAARRRSLWEFLEAVPTVIGRRSLDENIPAEAEMPAAAVLAVAGFAMEVLELCQTFG